MHNRKPLENSVPATALGPCTSTSTASSPGLPARIVYCCGWPKPGHRPSRSRDRSRVEARWLRQQKIALVESVNPKWENLRVEKAEKSRLAARDPSAAVGMTAKEKDRAQRRPFFSL